MKIVAELDDLGNVTFDESMYCGHCGGFEASFQEVATLASLFGKSVREVSACECHETVEIKLRLYTGPDLRYELSLDEKHTCPFCEGWKFNERQVQLLKRHLKNVGPSSDECTCAFEVYDNGEDN